MGSTLAEIDGAREWCRATIGPDKCPAERYDREGPVRQVRVSPFRMDVTEVTNLQFAEWLNREEGLVVDRGRYVLKGGRMIADLYAHYSPPNGIEHKGNRYKAYPGAEHKPVSQVTWEGATRYCVSHGKSLPTEAEWEYAARGATERRFPWGVDEPRCEGVTFARVPGMACVDLGIGPKDVGTSRQDRTPEGVRDLGGNVAEWVQDVFTGPYPPCPPGGCVDPQGPAPETKDSAPVQRVVRGGGWSVSIDATRAAGRSRAAEIDAPVGIGFRCVARQLK